MADLSGLSTDELLKAAGVPAPSDLSSIPTDELLKAAASAPSGPDVHTDPTAPGNQVGSVGGTPAFRSPNGDLYVSGADEGKYVKVPPTTKLDASKGQEVAKFLGLDPNDMSSPIKALTGRALQMYADWWLKGIADQPKLTGDPKVDQPILHQMAMKMAMGFVGPGVGDARLAMGGAEALRGTSKILGDAAANVSPEDLKSALDLVNKSHEMGSPITLPEAIQKVTNNGTNLADVQRVVEQSRKGGPIMKEFFADRPANNAQMVGNAVDSVAGDAAPIPPTEIGPRVQDAAASNVDAARQVVNEASQPAYNATANGTEQLTEAGFSKLLGNAAVEKALQAVRTDPIKYGDLSTMPDNSLQVLDAAKKYLDDVSSTADRAGANYAAKNASSAAALVKDSIVGEYPRYASALNIQSAGNRYLVEPIQRSPLGQLADTGDIAQQGKIILDTNPLPGSEKQVADAVSAIVAKDPDAARQLVASKLTQTFNETAQNLRSGPNQAGGASFAAAIRGNGQQAKNLEAAVRALPNGNAAWQGFNDMLDVLEAQGTRQVPGSQTEFNAQIVKDMGQGGVRELGAVAASPGKWLSLVDNLYQRLRYGQNAKLFAQVFTDPEAITQLQQLQKVSKTSLAARAIVANVFASKLIDAEQPADGQPEQPK